MSERIQQQLRRNQRLLRRAKRKANKLQKSKAARNDLMNRGRRLPGSFESKSR